MRNPKYIYKVGVWEGFGPDGYTYTEVRPHLADLAKEYSIESSYMFFRASIEGKIVLVGNDFDIVNVPWAEPKYIFQIDREIEIDGVPTIITEYRGEFFRTDCTFDIKNKTVQIKPTAIDGYTNVLSGLDKEYNLVELAPAKMPVTMYKRRITQVYMPGDNVITNILDGVYWETECERVYSDSALEGWNWKATDSLTPYIDISNFSPNEDVYPSGVLGRYTKISSEWRKTGTSYRIRFVVDEDDLFRRGRYELYNSSDSKILFATSWRLSGDLKFSRVDRSAIGVLRGVMTTSSDMITSTAYVRWILEREAYNGVATTAIKANDHAGMNENYTRTITLPTDKLPRIVNSENYSDTPTEWGMAPNGKYYMPPLQPEEWYIPIARNRWGSSSIWYKWTEDETEIDGRLPFKSNDCYLLSSAISALLGKIAPGITHEPTTEYSRILYGDNPIGDKFTFLLTQKTNILKSNYTQAATKAPITLQSITKLLQAYQMFWYIEDNKFKIEHILFFRNGGSYSRAANVGVDLTNMINPSIRRTYADADAANTYSFDKLDMPERYEFEWMDDTSAPFASSPIIINSGMAQPGKSEDISIGQFMPDIDYMMLNPSEVSEDGFAIMAAAPENLLDLYLRPLSSGGVSPGYYFAPNIWYDIADGEEKPNPVMVGRKIPCTPGETYTLRYRDGVPTDGALHMCYYDESGEWIDRGGQTRMGSTFTTPENCYYVAISFYIDIRYPGYIVNWKDITQLTSSGYALPMVRTELPGLVKDADGKGVPYTAQNGYMMWSYIIPKYWPYNLPSRTVIINGKPVYLEHISRKRKQENVKFPSEFEPDLFKLVRTNIGDGQIQKLSINLNSRMNTVQLNYDTE